MFVHLHKVHLLDNLLGQLFCGVYIESTFGGFFMSKVFFAGGLTSSILKTMIIPGNLYAGSSGGSYALIAACIIASLINIKTKGIILVLPLILSSFYFVGNVIIPLYNDGFRDRKSVHHLFGFIGGVLVVCLDFFLDSV